MSPPLAPQDGQHPLPMRTQLGADIVRGYPAPSPPPCPEPLHWASHIQVSRSFENLEGPSVGATLVQTDLEMDSAAEKFPEAYRRGHPASDLEVLEAEQDSLHLSLLGLGLQLQDLERGPGCWALAQSRMVQLRALQEDLRGAAERVEALIMFGEGLAQRSKLRAWAALEQILRALGAHRDTIFRRLWQLQAQLVSYSLVFEEANTLDQDLEIEGDSDWPGPGGVWGPWAPSSLPTSAELEWDPAGDIGGLGPLGQKTAWILGAPCELCGHRGPQGRGQGLEEPHTSHSRQDMLESSLSHRRKHLAGHRRRSLLRKRQDKKRQASPHLEDVRLEGNPGAPDPASRWPLTFLLILFLLFFLLVGAMFLLPVSGGPCCFHARMPRIPYLVLSYVNGLPPV
ncbi:Nesprin-4 [Saguinus oedipus]|uniref:Nesprin-4 n=1 Tax=Saguinus oedipus TaxID=9490 RepID=A0ABQ9TU07_SAGOE|nr:Nesprin-4 [Saguinus oedipus]